MSRKPRVHFPEAVYHVIFPGAEKIPSNQSLTPCPFSGLANSPFEHIFNVNHCVFPRGRIDYQPMTVIALL
jgi:hypothetical protein